MHRNQKSLPCSDCLSRGDFQHPPLHINIPPRQRKAIGKAETGEVAKQNHPLPIGGCGGGKARHFAGRKSPLLYPFRMDGKKINGSGGVRPNIALPFSGGKNRSNRLVRKVRCGGGSPCFALLVPKFADIFRSRCGKWKISPVAQVNKKIRQRLSVSLGSCGGMRCLFSFNPFREPPLDGVIIQRVIARHFENLIEQFPGLRGGESSTSSQPCCLLKIGCKLECLPAVGKLCGFFQPSTIGSSVAAKVEWRTRAFEYARHSGKIVGKHTRVNHVRRCSVYQG